MKFNWKNTYQRRRASLFVPRMLAHQHSQEMRDYLKMFPNTYYDPNLSGWWIPRNSPELTVALLLGIRPLDIYADENRREIAAAVKKFVDNAV